MATLTRNYVLDFFFFEFRCVHLRTPMGPLASARAMALIASAGTISSTNPKRLHPTTSAPRGNGLPSRISGLGRVIPPQTVTAMNTNGLTVAQHMRRYT